MSTTDKVRVGSWQSQHTAGHDTHGQTAIYAEADGKTIAIVYDGKANACLIAAAPEMLELVKALYEWYSDSNEGPNIGTLLFNDEQTFGEHIAAILAKVEEK